MKRPIGFDVEHLQKKMAKLDTKDEYPLITEFVTHLSGEILAMRGVIHCILQTLSTSQQNEILAGMLARMKKVEDFKPDTPGGELLKESSLEMAQIFINPLKQRSKGTS